MLKIAVCDDYIQELWNTSLMVEEFIKSKPEVDICEYCFHSAHDLLESLDRDERFHIYLLDILMPEMNGIDVGAKIRERDEHAVIIYLTSSPDYALNSFKVFAFQCLIKPVSKDELYKTLDKALAKISSESALLLPVKTKNGMRAVLYHQIVFVEYIKHALRFHLSDNSVIASITSRDPFDKSISLLLNDRRFVKPHVAFAVNMSFVRTITAKDFVMTDGTLVPISQKNYANIKKQYIDFLLNGVTTSNAEHSQ